MNRVRSSLCMKCMLIGYSFEPRPNNRAFGTAVPVMNIGLSNEQNDARTRKTTILTGEIKIA